MKTLLAATVMALVAGAAVAQEPASLQLPPGFHATVVAAGLGPIRHLVVRANGDVYVSTIDRGILALHLDAQHKVDDVRQFSAVEGGTGIGFYQGDLYASSSTGVYRFRFASPSALVPAPAPELIVDNMPGVGPGFRRANHPLAFDGKGNMYISQDDSVNDFCFPPARRGAGAPAGARPGAAPGPGDAPRTGLKPCPDLVGRAGIWRFSATAAGQSFPSGGTQLATGVRDMTALAWSPTDGNLYGIMHGRDNMDRTFPGIISAQAQNEVADEMDRVTAGTNFGWPYTYYNGVKKLRLLAPGYGGNGTTPAPAGDYATPVVAFTPRSAPVALVFYEGDAFPATYHGGAFIALHGTRGENGYDVIFVPWNRQGKAGAPTVFASGFTRTDPPGQRSGRAGAGGRIQPEYRPVGLAVGPHGALYIADSQQGRIWRVSYGAN